MEHTDLEEASAQVVKLTARNAQLLSALEAIAEGRTLVMDDIGETFAESLQRDARVAILAAKGEA